MDAVRRLGVMPAPHCNAVQEDGKYAGELAGSDSRQGPEEVLVDDEPESSQDAGLKRSLYDADGEVRALPCCITELSHAQPAKRSRKQPAPRKLDETSLGPALHIAAACSPSAQTRSKSDCP